MNSNLKCEELDRLFRSILELKNIEECYAFFEDSCTTNELKAISQRLQVANMLISGKKYTEISSLTGASTATISRVNRTVNSGKGGFVLVWNRLNASTKENKDGDFEFTK